MFDRRVESEQILENEEVQTPNWIFKLNERSSRLETYPM